MGRKIKPKEQSKKAQLALDPWQQEVLDHQGDILLCTGRRVGKTYILARKAIDAMAKRSDCPVIIISLTEDQAYLILAMALNYARDFYPHLIGEGKERPTMNGMFVNHNRMVIRPVGNRGDGARGFEGGILIVDEAARMPQQFWIAARPTILTTNGQIWMASTPYGKQGYFWEQYNEAVNARSPNARFRVFEISTEECMRNRPISMAWTQEQREGALRILAEDKRSMSEREFLQEYGGRFVDDLFSYFPDKTVSACAVRAKDAPIPHGNRYLGVDIGATGGDETVLTSFAFVEGKKMIMFDMEITKYTSLPETIALIKEADKKYDYHKILIDSGGLGLGVAQPLAVDTQTSRKIIEINNSSRSIHRGASHHRIIKEDLYANLLQLMESGNVQFWDDDRLRLSLRSIQVEYKEGKQKIFGRYSHITEALIRACWPAIEKTLNIWCASKSHGA